MHLWTRLLLLSPLLLVSGGAYGDDDLWDVLASIEMFEEDYSVHDPSRILALEGGEQWMAATGKAQEDGYDCGLELWSRESPSDDWVPTTCILQDKPDWIEEALPDQDGAYWAPSFVDARTIVYGVAVNEDDQAGTCLGRVSQRGERWVDEGRLACMSGDLDPERSIIDPYVFEDADGDRWLVTGGGEIILTRFSGNQIAGTASLGGGENRGWTRLARGPQNADDDWVEAPAILYRDGFYYLFVNWGSCCRGTRSTYEIRVGRSESVEGPYLDQDGQDMRHGGGSLFLARQGREIGPGHFGFNRTTGQDRFSYHFYDRARGGESWIGERALLWSDGWPQAGDRLYNQF